MLKRPSNGTAEMKADRVERACLSRCQDLLPGTMSLGHGGGSMAPVFLEASANDVDSCAGGEVVSKAFPAVCVRYLAVLC